MTVIQFGNDLLLVKIIRKYWSIAPFTILSILLITNSDFFLSTTLPLNWIDLRYSNNFFKFSVLISIFLAVLFYAKQENEDTTSEKQDEFEALLENNADPIWVYDCETFRFLVVNESACRTYGYSRREFTSLTIMDLTQTGQLPELEKILRRSTQDSAQANIVKHKKKDGSFLLAEVTSYEIDFEGRKAKLEIVQDITQQIIQSEPGNSKQELEKKLQCRTEELQSLYKELEQRNKEIDAVNEELIAINELLAGANKKIIETAQSKADQFNRILGSLSDVVWSYDLIGNGDNYVSPSASEKYGIPLEDLRNSPLLLKEFIHPDDASIELASRQRLNLTGQSECTYRIIDKDQQVRWIYNRERIIRDNEGMAIRIEGISTDVTFLKQREQIIEEQEFRLRAVFEYLDMSITIVDRNGKILLFNKMAEKHNDFFQMPIGIGVNFKDLALPDRKEIIQDIFDRVVNTKTSFRYTVKYHNRNNDKHYFSVCYNPVICNNGEVTQVCIMARDITHEQLADEKLRREKNLLRTLIDNLPDYIYVKDRELKHIINNKANVKLIGARSERETLGKTAEDYFPAEVAKRFIQDDLHIINSGKILTNKEEEVVDGNGQNRCLLTTKIPIRDKRGNVTGLVGISRDITELTDYKKSLEKKVLERTSELNAALDKEKQIVEMKNRFVSIASHEFRTPLSTIRFAAGFLKKFHKRISENELNNKLDNIEAQVNNMTQLLDDVLTIGKSESGKMKINPVAVDVNRFIDQIIEEVKYSTGNTHAVEKTVTAEPVIISSDEKYLRNIFINLITNAIKFSPGKEKVFIDIKTERSKVFISVKDHGIGINANDFNAIFEPFQRGSNVLNIQGTGLGLPIVKKAVDILNGGIQVESRVGEGSMFTVNFPLHEINSIYKAI